MTTIQQFERNEESLIIGLEVRRYADGYWQIDGIATCAGRVRPSDRIPLVSGKKAISQPDVAVLQALIQQQLATIVTLTGEWENL